MSILCFKEKDGTLNMRVVGTLTRDPELKQNSKGDKVSFSVAYGQKKYLRCEFWANSTAGRLAGCLEKGDHVSVDGIYQEWKYNDKTYSVVRGELLTVQMDAPAAEPEGQPQQEAGAGADGWSEMEAAGEGGLPF